MMKFVTFSDLKITRPPRNETVLEGHRFSFPCKAKGHPSPHIRWFHNGEQMNKNGHNYHISNKSGTLRISNVYVVDRGEYQCRADNGADPPVLSQQVYLTVNGKIPTGCSLSSHSKSTSLLTVRYPLDVACPLTASLPHC